MVFFNATNTVGRIKVDELSTSEGHLKISLLLMEQIRLTTWDV